VQNATFYSIVMGLIRAGKLPVTPPERLKARQNDTEARAIMAGCKPMSEKKLYATEKPGWREGKAC
jgi:hypothetical protein